MRCWREISHVAPGARTVVDVDRPDAAELSFDYPKLLFKAICLRMLCISVFFILCGSMLEPEPSHAKMSTIDNSFHGNSPSSIRPI